MRNSGSSIPMCTCVPKISSDCASSAMSAFTPMYRSSGVISCVTHEENGCVPAAATRSPLFATCEITEWRSFTSSALAAEGVLHTFVPTSTIDWCSSGFTCSRMMRSPSRISWMYDFSSRVSGSIIWYSSSIPIVSEGAFIALPVRDGRSSRLEHVRRNIRATAGGDVEQRGSPESRHAPFHVRAVAHERRGVEHPIEDPELAIDHRWIGLCRERDAILHDVRLLPRGREPRLPLGVGGLPAEHDPLAAVFIVRLEYESFPAVANEARQVDLLAIENGMPVFYHASPRHVHPDRRRLLHAEQASISFIAQYGETRLLVQQLAREGVDHAHGVVAHRADHRPVDATPLHELVDQHALVDERDLEIPRAQRAIS